jgi:tRNA 2-thiouridine synthesizing protein A
MTTLPLTKEKLMADFDLDLRGLSCPLPVMRMRKKLESMTSGQTLCILSSEAGSVRDINAYVNSSGDTLLESKKTPEGDFEFLLKRV